MKILITGGAGFIGSHLVDALSKDKKDSIIILDNFYRGRIQNIKHNLKSKNIRLINGDIRNYNSLKRIGKIDIIYHLAAQSNVIGSSLNPDYAFSSNVDGTYNILKYASKNNVKGFVFASSREVYGNPQYIPVDEKHPLNPINMYGALKASGEMLCRAFIKSHKLNVHIVRITNGYGPRDRDRVIPIFLENASKNKDLELYGGKQILDFIWIRDIINGIIQVSKRDDFVGEAVNIGTGKGTSIEDLAKNIIKITGSKSEIVRKKSRGIDVKKFIAKTGKIKLKTLKLGDGLKKMLG
ncbi:nucleoside-diphosphate sugar epimerase [Candidatus Woesearchaeota archaeon]|jgi:UDP-glucose 4-epimerase|nr:nucleoside-diphosphate sugar epimerase [Candidatus Woesearchaeota archaeon]MDP6647834.1 NAD-dependent epimerase/dehydratase family protein [Candidatus Woesearchaeota archaeon]|tara:strand:+ start:1286 stop:2173 length:888 start_codon:yes stop_codon:yes gene_type:complete